MLQAHRRTQSGRTARVWIRVSHGSETESASTRDQDTGGRDARGPFRRRRTIINPHAGAIPSRRVDGVDRGPPDGRGPDGLAVRRWALLSHRPVGSMRLTVPSSPGWYLKSITIGGVDVTDRPFDFAVLATRRSLTRRCSLEGRCQHSRLVAGAPGRRDAPFTVVAFRRTVRTGLPDRNI